MATSARAWENPLVMEPTRVPRLSDRGSPYGARRLAVALGVWAAGYAAYRFYYALGGQFGMIGRPAPAAHFRRDNLVGGAIILLAAVLPSIAVWAWSRRRVRGLVPVVGWIAAVGGCMHAVTLAILRVLSLSGVHPTRYPPGLWLSLDRHTRPSSRPRWRRSAVVACALLAAVGVLSGLGAIPTFRSG
jgi:hypothetical protein